MAVIHIPRSNFGPRLHQAVLHCEDGDTLVVPDEKAREYAKGLLFRLRTDEPLIFVEIYSERDGTDRERAAGV